MRFKIWTEINFQFKKMGGIKNERIFDGRYKSVSYTHLDVYKRQEYKRCWKRNVEILGNKKTGQGLPEELGKYIWLAKADTSQEAPASKSGSSSLCRGV